MATKADLQRTRMALQAERLNLKQQELDLNERRRTITRERSFAIAILRVVCERYGDNDWSEDQRLDAIIQEHLAAPLDRTTRRVSRRLAELRLRAAESETKLRLMLANLSQETPAPPAPAPARERVPRPLRPTPVPQVEHRCVTVRAQLRDQHGYRATCLCGYRTPFERTEELAILEGDRHVTRSTDEHQAAHRDAR